MSRDSREATRNPFQLCLVTDPTHAELERVVTEALAAGISMLQLRGHTLSAASLYALARRFLPLCNRYQTALIVNDRLDVGLAAGAHGFQLGRRSLPVAVARSLVGPEMLLGVSVHSLEEAREAVEAGADYLLAGTLFPSHSHPGERTAGIGLIRALRQAYPALPLIGIGGITSENAAEVIEAGANGVAVISALFQAPSVSVEVERLRRASDRKGEADA
ncbi:thiamine-phosphate pyrophosphorylase [Thermosporothrix hazakensis]|jgi:thiamine-phosphate pyrophosphorylase|uniref:Thiamine-phosphate synthase n=2 Tax=Thermosporothrix TaxID=768650 RepID=A0A326U112_THEHA|nr:thiamine phosphate synthase [Thermosporothrix hazakensis]PZW24214.1 thiamine-phosphate pyrophosphorylase [Thermosporothrix hazakensis]BBH89659.1 thiamine-phosphate synthase [Thermosporothrix sp. COM3]GCE47845.1 thiamine-phosphate synthase [Thermosporothrix hazakensis]